MSNKPQNITLTLTAEQIARLDAEAHRLEQEHHVRVSRSAVARRWLDNGAREQSVSLSVAACNKHAGDGDGAE